MAVLWPLLVLLDQLTKRADASLTAAKVYEHMCTGRSADEKDNPVALVGWSDCGERIWQPLGRAFTASEVAWSADEFLPPEEEVDMLDFDQAIALADHDAAVLANKLAALPTVKTRFCIQPTRELFEASLLHARETLRYRRGERYVPSHYGVRLADDTYALWIHQAGEDALVFTRFEAPDADRAELLLRVAAKEASWWGLRRLLAWDVDEKLLKKGEVTPMARSFNVPLAALLDELETGEKLDWCFIERFAVVLES